MEYESRVICDGGETPKRRNESRRIIGGMGRMMIGEYLESGRDDWRYVSKLMVSEVHWRS